jgi:hypothetical protein
MLGAVEKDFSPSEFSGKESESRDQKWNAWNHWKN